MSTAYWSNLRTEFARLANALVAWGSAIAPRIEDPLYDDVIKARYRIISYDNDAKAVDDAIAYIRKLPSIRGSDRESFIEYAEALQEFVIFGVDAYSASKFVTVCVVAEGIRPTDKWDTRIRTLGRVITTGYVSRDDYQALRMSGVPLSERLVGKNIHWEYLLADIRDILPYILDF